MKLPESLPVDMFLLACDPRRQRAPRRSHFGFVLAASALCDLRLRGVIADNEGRVAVRSHTDIGDPFLDMVRRRATGERRRTWRSLVRSGARSAYRTVREQLVASGVIRLTHRRFLGLIPYQRAEIVDWRPRERLVRAFDAALDGGRPINRVDQRDVALVALAAVGAIRSAAPWSVRRAYRGRIKELVAGAGPALPALRRVLREAHTAAG